MHARNQVKVVKELHSSRGEESQHNLAVGYPASQPCHDDLDFASGQAFGYNEVPAL